MVKICFLTDDPAEIGGGPEHIRQISKILRQKYGCIVEVITPLAMDPKFNFDNFWHRIRFTFWVLKFLIISDDDIYHSHAFSTNLFLPIVRFRGNKAGITIHGSGKDITGAGILNKIGIQKFLRWLIFSVWPFDFRLSASNLPGFVTVGNGVDVTEFSKIKRQPHKIFTILCISRRDPAKGVRILEEAVRNLKDVKLHLVSGRRRIMADFARADLYVLPSLSEGLPIVLLEAMAARLPVIATDVGDCREIIQKSGCGIIVKPGDPSELARAIAQMIAKKDFLKLGKNGYDFVKANYTWNKATEKIWKGYHCPNLFLTAAGS